MAEFSITTRIITKEGVYPVYISIAHNGKTRYIKTEYSVTQKGIKSKYSKSGKEKIEVSDKFVVKQCLNIINEYIDKCNRIGIFNMDCTEIVDILKGKSEDISFTKYAQSYISKIKEPGTARNHIASLNKLTSHIGKANVSFSDITNKTVSDWIESLATFKRAKSMYPSIIKKIFYAALDEYNDYDKNIIRIPHDPFRKIKIPKEDTVAKRSVSVDLLKKFFESTPLEEVNFRGKMYVSREKMSQDVAKLIICLAGINAADLYDLKKESLKDGKICYLRKKVRNKRGDGAYMEISIPSIIFPIIEKYKGDKDSLFSFSQRYADAESFDKYVNKGMKKICCDIDIPKMTTYSIRHSWATIAQNDCGASTELVAFSLIHASAHKVTDGYIRKIYTPVDDINKKVIDFIFN